MGSPDLEKALLFGFWCSNSHAQNVQANGRFCLLARGSIFSKGALRAVGAMAFVAAALEAATCFDVKAVADGALRCAGLSLCCVCGSSAASTSAVGWSSRRLAQEQEQRKRSIGKRAALVAGCNSSVEFFLPPVFSKGGESRASRRRASSSVPAQKHVGDGGRTKGRPTPVCQSWGLCECERPGA